MQLDNKKHKEWEWRNQKSKQSTVSISMMSFYIIKSQTEETLQKIKKIPCSLLFAVSARDLPDLVKTTAPSDPPLQFSQ